MFRTIAPPWIQPWYEDHDAAYSTLRKVRGELAPHGIFVGSLRGDRMRNRKGVFDQFSTLLQFPRHFGENWNAFVDCMQDLDLLHSCGFLIVVLDAMDVLVDGDEDEYRLLCKVLSEAGESWAQTTSLRSALPFRVVLHETQERAMGLSGRLGPRLANVPRLQM